MQVYGGAISAMIGPYVRSFIGIGDANASCGDTICDNCVVFMFGISIINSLASSNTIGNMPTTFMQALSASVLKPLAGDSYGASVRACLRDAN